MKNQSKRTLSPSIQKIEVLRVGFIRGENSEDNPYRYVTQYCNFDGEVLAEYDPFLDEDLNAVRYTNEDEEDTQ